VVNVLHQRTNHLKEPEYDFRMKQFLVRLIFHRLPWALIPLGTGLTKKSIRDTQNG